METFRDAALSQQVTKRRRGDPGLQRKRKEAWHETLAQLSYEKAKESYGEPTATFVKILHQNRSGLSQRCEQSMNATLKKLYDSRLKDAIKWLTSNSSTNDSFVHSGDYTKDWALAIESELEVIIGEFFDGLMGKPGNEVSHSLQESQSTSQSFNRNIACL